MKNKNKLLAPALGFAGLMTSSLSFALVGCGNNNNKEEPAEIQNGITRGGEFGSHKQSDQYETSWTTQTTFKLDEEYSQSDWTFTTSITLILPNGKVLGYPSTSLTLDGSAGLKFYLNGNAYNQLVKDEVNVFNVTITGLNYNTRELRTFYSNNGKDAEHGWTLTRTA